LKVVRLWPRTKMRSDGSADEKLTQLLLARTSVEDSDFALWFLVVLMV